MMAYPPWAPSGLVWLHPPLRRGLCLVSRRSHISWLLRLVLVIKPRTVLSRFPKVWIQSYGYNQSASKRAQPAIPTPGLPQVSPSSCLAARMYCSTRNFHHPGPCELERKLQLRMHRQHQNPQIPWKTPTPGGDYSTFSLSG